MNTEEIRPYGTGTHKGEEIEAMFDHIAPAYDFMNGAMSLGQHRRWRNRALEEARMALRLKPGKGDIRILDVATGTGDVAFSLAKKFPGSSIVGLDLSKGMLEIGRKRLKKEGAPAGSQIDFQQGDCLDLPFGDDSFDLVTVAYGVRNFENLAKGISEMRRVLRPGGVLCIIELARPENRLALTGYRIYTRLIPLAGRMIAGDSDAYSYLPQSIAACPQRRGMVRLMEQVGLKSCRWHELTLGTVCIYIGKKQG